jgi:hypothetical protein
MLMQDSVLVIAYILNLTCTYSSKIKELDRTFEGVVLCQGPGVEIEIQELGRILILPSSFLRLP